jgi:hypothetical protein
VVAILLSDHSHHPGLATRRRYFRRTEGAATCGMHWMASVVARESAGVVDRRQCTAGQLEYNLGVIAPTVTPIWVVMGAWKIAPGPRLNRWQPDLPRRVLGSCRHRTQMAPDRRSTMAARICGFEAWCQGFLRTEHPVRRRAPARSDPIRVRDVSGPRHR